MGILYKKKNVLKSSRKVSSTPMSWNDKTNRPAYYHKGSHEVRTYAVVKEPRAVTKAFKNTHAALKGKLRSKRS